MNAEHEEAIGKDGIQMANDWGLYATYLCWGLVSVIAQGAHI